MFDKTTILEAYTQHLKENNSFDLSKFDPRIIEGIIELNDARNNAIVYLEDYKNSFNENILYKGYNGTFNYKLHDLSFHIFKNIDRIKEGLSNTSLGSDFDVFNDFCKIEWRNFEEWQKENNIDANMLTDYIGRSSSFKYQYLDLDKIANDFINDYVCSHMGTYFTICDGDLENDVTETIIILDEVFNFYWEHYDLRYDSVFNEDEDYNIVNICDELNTIADDFRELKNLYSYLLKCDNFKDSITLAEHLTTFKQNSIELFEEYFKFLLEEYAK